MAAQSHCEKPLKGGHLACFKPKGKWPAPEHKIDTGMDRLNEIGSRMACLPCLLIRAAGRPGRGRSQGTDLAALKGLFIREYKNLGDVFRRQLFLLCTNQASEDLKKVIEGLHVILVDVLPRVWNRWEGEEGRDVFWLGLDLVKIAVFVKLLAAGKLRSYRPGLVDDSFFYRKKEGPNSLEKKHR